MQGYNSATTRLFRCSMLANSSIPPSKVYSGLRVQNGLGVLARTAVNFWCRCCKSFRLLNVEWFNVHGACSASRPHRDYGGLQVLQGFEDL